MVGDVFVRGSESGRSDSKIRQTTSLPAGQLLEGGDSPALITLRGGVA